ncbi:MAG: PLP-dependent transferase [Deltaproteobacteria bacterium]|nr:PLP-dependent transferase [Deltaproteobacteria bacterium]
MKQSTVCVHAGTIRGKMPQGANSPILTSTSFNYLDTDYNIYPRYFNIPNQNAVIEKLCSLENTETGVLFGSGMAAITCSMLALLKTGDHAVIQKDIYGGTHHLLKTEFEKFGIDYTFVSNDINEIKSGIQKNTKIIYIETPSNPLLIITDIKAVAEIAKANNIITLIDNTFATPINQKPYDLGIDIVIHSGTKYLGGHSDITCGVALTSKEITEKIRVSAYNFGAHLDAQTCYLLERSLKTLNIRVEKQCKNAMIIAEELEKEPKIKKVYYPGLKSHSGHEIAKKQMKNFGAVVSFELDEEKTDIKQFLKKLKLIMPALSLGGVESLICVPAVTSHAKVSEAERLKIGITNNLFRLSVGIEDTEDLLADIKQAAV